MRSVYMIASHYELPYYFINNQKELPRMMLKIVTIFFSLILSSTLYAADATIDVNQAFNKIQDTIKQLQQNTIEQMTALQKQVTDNTTNQVNQLQGQLQQSNNGNATNIAALQASIQKSHDALQKEIDDLQKQLLQMQNINNQNLNTFTAETKKSNDAVQDQIAKINDKLVKIMNKVGL